MAATLSALLVTISNAWKIIKEDGGDYDIVMNHHWRILWNDNDVKSKIIYQKKKTTAIWDKNI